METKQLSKYANTILKSYWNNILPVDPFTLLRSSGWRVFFSDSLIESNMDFFIDQEEKHIYMNAKLLEDAYKSRVVCAKSFAYALTSSRETPLSEKDAMGFAAEILIPELFLGLISDIEESVNRFAVTSDLVRIRRNQMTSLEYTSTTGFQPVELSK